MRQGITKEINNKRYYSYDIDGVQGRAFHIQKGTENPEIHIDVQDRPFQVFRTESEVIIVFGHKKKNGNLILEE